MFSTSRKKTFPEDGPGIFRIFIFQKTCLSGNLSKVPKKYIFDDFGKFLAKPSGDSDLSSQRAGVGGSITLVPKEEAGRWRCMPPQARRGEAQNGSAELRPGQNLGVAFSQET